MKNKIFTTIFLVFLFVLILLAIKKDSEPDYLPTDTSYFDLLQIDSDKIDSIKVIYETGHKSERSKKTEIKVLKQSDPVFQEFINLFKNVELRLESDLDWHTMKNRYKIGNVQLVFCCSNVEYELPVLDIYEKERSKPHPTTWFIYDDSYIYSTNLEEILDKNLYQGLALYLEKWANPYIKEKDLIKIKIPEYYGINQNANSWNFDCNYDSLFSNSEYIFKGKVISASLKDGYEVEIIENYKGNCLEGVRFIYQDGTGYDKESNTYYALVNETERYINDESEYVFFMKSYPIQKSVNEITEVEYVYLTDRQCGICEIIDDKVWPIFNAKPGTSWFVGQSLNEIISLSKNEE